MSSRAPAHSNTRGLLGSLPENGFAQPGISPAPLGPSARLCVKPRCTGADEGADVPVHVREIDGGKVVFPILIQRAEKDFKIIRGSGGV